MSAQFQTTIPVDLARPPHSLPLPHQLALKDAAPFVLTALVYDSSAETPTEVLSDTVTGQALRPDGATVELSGSKGNALVDVTDERGQTWKATPCSVTVTQSCLTIPGRLVLSIVLSTGTTVSTTVITVTLTVIRTNSETIVDGSEVIININQMISDISDAKEAAEAAAAAAENIVSYAEQSLTDAQKKQARTNIAAYGEAETGIVPITGFTAGYYIGEGSSPISLTPSASGTGFSYKIVDCAPGDAFLINAGGGTTPRAWCFIDSGNNILDIAASGTITGAIIQAPVGAEKLIINHNVNNLAGAVSYKLTEVLHSEIEGYGQIRATSTHNLWHNGTYDVTTGRHTPGTANHICTLFRQGVPTGVKRIYTTGSVNMHILAWNATTGEYIGFYNSNREWSKTSANYYQWTDFDCTAFPNYVFAIAAQYGWGTSNIAPSAGQNVKYQAIDESLSLTGFPADAKATGDAIYGARTPIAMTSGYYIKTSTDPVDLTPVSSSTGFAYAIVNCSEGDYFTINANGGTNPRTWCFVDSDANVLGVALSGAAANNTIIRAPKNAAKLIINDNSGSTSYTGAKNADVEKYQQENEWLSDGLFKIFQRVGVIGDSLSVGCIQYPSDDAWLTRGLKYSWVKQAGRDSGVPWLNLGQSGFNVLTWCSDSTYGKVQMEASGNKCQAYIIGLGCNDEWNAGHHVDLGTTSDIVDNPDTVATTYYGGYNRIIQLLKQHNPLCKIFCLTNPVAVESAGYNDAVRYIATEHYTTEDNVYLVEFAGEKEYLYNTQYGLGPDRYGVHFSPVGYRMIANIIERELNAVIRANQAEFMEVSRIPCDTTDPTPNTMTE